MSVTAHQELYRVEAWFERGECRGDVVLILRSDPRWSPPQCATREVEAEVINLVADFGANTPRARWLVRDLVRPGAYAFFMELRRGVAEGRKVVDAVELSPARTALSRELAVELATVHRIRPSHAPDLFVTPAPADPLRHAVARAEGLLAYLEEPQPALEIALRWLLENQPDPRPCTLIHGDFRTGNFLLSEDGLEAVLDWERAHWGFPEIDVGWLCLREWRFDRLSLPVGGFAPRARFYDDYEMASGTRLDPHAVRWAEVLANVEQAALCLLSGARYLRGESHDIADLALGRRALEMSFEALRLMEV